MNDIHLVHGVHLPQSIRERNETIIRASFFNFLNMLYETCNRLPGNIIVNSQSTRKWEALRHSIIACLLTVTERYVQPEDDKAQTPEVIIKKFLAEAFDAHILPIITEAKEYMRADVSNIHQVRMSCSKLRKACMNSNRRSCINTWWKNYGGNLFKFAMEGFIRMRDIGAVIIKEDLAQWTVVKHGGQKELVGWLLPICIEIVIAANDALETIERWLKEGPKGPTWSCVQIFDGMPKNPRCGVSLPIQAPSHIASFRNDVNIYISTVQRRLLKQRECIIPLARVMHVLSAILCNNHVEIESIGKDALTGILSGAYAEFENNVTRIVHNTLDPTSQECGMNGFPHTALIG